MYYTKKQLLNKLIKKYHVVKELQETDKKLIVQADNFKIEVKKQLVANFKREMVLMYQY